MAYVTKTTVHGKRRKGNGFIGRVIGGILFLTVPIHNEPSKFFYFRNKVNVSDFNSGTFSNIPDINFKGFVF